jgi:pseudaminic acid synthase
MTVNREKTLIIAELSANHGGDYETAAATIRAAAEAGADAVKLQTYTPDTITLDCDSEHFCVGPGTPWEGRTLHDLYREAHTPWEWHEGLIRTAAGQGLICFSSPFDATAVDFLEGLHVPAYKIASFEITDIPLIEYAASKGKPMLISTGIATLDEIEGAVDACRRMGNERITLLQCTSAYPARAEEANLLRIPDLRARFGTAVGLSDHTLGHTVAAAAVALGACVIEKHLILSRSIGGPDAAFSMEPDEFRAMTAAIRQTEAALGEASYELSRQALAGRRFARSLFVVEDIAKGEPLTGRNIRSIRPSDGLPPKYLPLVLGRRALRDLKRGTPLRATDFE